ncbi:MAG: hypothetical protein Q8P67_21555, partial [archaeon]|nr:hypothetical protein [archaeon]
RLRSARDSASRLQQDISRQLVDKEKPKCDSDDSRNRFAPPAYSIHSSVNVSSHRCVRDFLATFSAHHNSAEPVSKSTIVDSIRVSLSLD